MDVALVRFVGAGITSVAAGLGVQVPQGAIEGGYNLVSYLLANNPERTRGLIEGAVRELWADWRRSGLPPKVASTHLGALPALMDLHRPADDRFVGALAVAKTALRSGPAAVMVPSRRIATSIVTAARQSESMPPEVSEAIALFFLERLYCHLLMERNALLELGPTLDAYFYKSLWRGKTYDPAVLAATTGESGDEPPSLAETLAGSEPVAAEDGPERESPATPPAAPVLTDRPSLGAASKRTPAFGLGGAAGSISPAVPSPLIPIMSPPPIELVEPVQPAASPPPIAAPVRPGQPVFRELVVPPNAAPRLPRQRGPSADPQVKSAAAEPAPIENAPPAAEAEVACSAPLPPEEKQHHVALVAAVEPRVEMDIAAPIAAALAEPEPEREPVPAPETEATSEPQADLESELMAPAAAPMAELAGFDNVKVEDGPAEATTAGAAVLEAATDEITQSMVPGAVDELENDPLVQEISSRTGAPARVVAALADDLMANGDGGPLDEDVLIAACTSAAGLLDTLRTGGGRAAAAQAHRTAAILAMMDGNLDGVDGALAAAEDEELKAAQRDINVSRGHLSQASATRSARAELAKLRGDLRGAARHYATAARCLSPLDRAGRWDMLCAQTRVLIELARTRDGAPVLLEAVDTLRQAVGVIGQREAALEWAQAHKRIAELLLEAQLSDGQRSHAVEAIEHVDHAIEVLSRARATDAWADAQILKGIALQRLATSDEGRHNLDQAIEAFRSALGPLSASRTPLAQAKALARLGLALKDLGDRANDTGAFVEAITQLRAAADIDETVLRGAGFDASDIVVATAGAIEALSGLRRDPDLLTGAISELRRAATLMAAAAPLPLAAVEEKLSATLERLGRHRRDPAMLQEAARVRLSAHDRHEMLGHRQIADRLRDELETLHDYMARLASDGGGKAQVYARAS